VIGAKRQPPERVTPGQIGHTIRGRYSGGRSKRRPYRERAKASDTEISNLKFQIEETANSNLHFKANANTNANTDANANANADPSPLKAIRDDRREAFFRGQ
jgi:hypothetical protein